MRVHRWTFCGDEMFNPMFDGLRGESRRSCLDNLLESLHMHHRQLSRLPGEGHGHKYVRIGLMHKFVRQPSNYDISPQVSYLLAGSLHQAVAVERQPL